MIIAVELVDFFVPDKDTAKWVSEILGIATKIPFECGGMGFLDW